MYSYLHRRLIDNAFRQNVHEDNENFEYFNKQRIPNGIECALPKINWLDSEQFFLQNLKIYFSDSSGRNRDGHHMSYNANKIYADYLYQQWRQENES